ncbi:putative Nicotinamide/nicotinic acid mononucleotide adenylyltransferase 1 [Hypsibius exemplaris]|uniref:Nicotinamide/nicotinic acid mononucleotide adenylyltransferase 3 n=1 Tax=Hypsibius exemplaris TaxID=2072580 RepID=A0A1W0WQR7_HYPEX|nr:putative Nicotinamide/nicotinic acid mononucleotide adenylyltransferase 1 [Hypsibius exemplaris]
MLQGGTSCYETGQEDRCVVIEQWEAAGKTVEHDVTHVKSVRIKKMKKIVLLCVGSFNPITFMHLRMFVLAKEYLYDKLQWNVLEGLISPVHDAYKKKNLAPSHHRAKMLELAINEHQIPWIKLSTWEVEQEGWSKTLDTMDHHQVVLNGSAQLDTTKDVNSDDHVQVMLLCGSDLVESFLVPGLWSEVQLERICRGFGVVCVTREGVNIQDTIRGSPLLSKFADDIVIVPEWFPNQVSSTSIRAAVRKGLCIGMLVPMTVAAYIKQHRLYHGDTQIMEPLVFVFKATKSADTADPFVEVLQQLHFRVALIPVLTFQFLGLPEYQAALYQPECYSGLILTSPRTVEALALAIKSNEDVWQKKYLAEWNAKPVYVIGEGTAALAREIGLTSVCGDTTGCEVNLSEFIRGRKELHEKKLLLPCGDLRLETLRLSLSEQQIPVEFVEVYETSAHPKLVATVHEKLALEGFPDVVVFFSPSGVQFMDEILRAESVAFKQAKYVAIGPTTAEALKSAGYPVSAVANKPTPDGVAQAVKTL